MSDYKPGIHWAHFYGEGVGGQSGPPISDVHEGLNRLAAEEAIKYADEILRHDAWNFETAEVLETNMADLSTKASQAHDIRWAFGPGMRNESFCNSGFLNFEHLEACACANWLAFHLHKNDLESKIARLTTMETNLFNRRVQFDQPMPAAARIGSASPYPAGGCCSTGQKRKWPGCA